MAYTAEISRTNPTCFLLLVDQSGSMAEPFGAESGKSKAEGVAEAVNRLLQTLVARCAKGEHILDRYYVGVIGYGGEVRLGFPVDALAGDVLQPISRIGACPLRIEDRIQRVDDGAGGMRDQHIKFPVWFEPKAQGKTPMCAAFRAATDVLDGFLRRYPKCFPPIVINVSDGAATDGAFEPEAMAIWRLASDGRQRPAVQHPHLCQGRKADPVPQRRSRSAGRLCPAIVQHIQPSCRPRCFARPASWRPR